MYNCAAGYRLNKHTVCIVHNYSIQELMAACSTTGNSVNDQLMTDLNNHINISHSIFSFCLYHDDTNSSFHVFFIFIYPIYGGRGALHNAKCC